MFLGDKATLTLMMTAMVFGVFSGAISLIMYTLVPLWVLFPMAILAAIFILIHLSATRGDHVNRIPRGSMQKPLERAVALALMLQFFIPWLDQVLRLGIF